MPFVVGTLESIHEEILADFGNRFPGWETSRFSDNWKHTRVLALAAYQQHAHIDQAYQDLLPDKSADALLDRHGNIYGVPRKGASISHKANALRLVGTSTSAFTSGAVLVHRDGTRYQITESGTIPVAGFIDVDVESIDTGSQTRKQAGQTLSFQSAPTGIRGVAELQIDLDEGGEDRESAGAYRARILAKIAFPGMGGNRHDYEAWALEVAGVATAYVYPLRQGLGSVDVAALHAGRGSARLLTVTELAALQAHLDFMRPVSVAEFRVLTVVAESADVEVMVTPLDAPYAFDWDDSTAPTVAAYNASTRVLTLSERPGDLGVGDRMVYVNTATRNDGTELIVEALGPGAADVTLVPLTAAQASAPPAVGAYVYSGGPLVADVRARLLALIDSLGPGRGLAASGDWEDTLRTSLIFKETLRAAGVREVTIVRPPANVVPSNAAPSGTIGLVIPRQIIVRRG